MPRAIATMAGKAGKHYPRLLAPTMVLTGLILGCAPAMAQSQSSDLLALLRLQEPIELDGRAEEPAKDRVRAISLTQHNTKLSIEPFVHYDSDLGSVAANPRIRYNAREGTDLFLVYNEGLNTDRSFAEPRLPVSSHRTVLLKYTHTFGR